MATVQNESLTPSAETSVVRAEIRLIIGCDDGGVAEDYLQFVSQSLTVTTFAEQRKLPPFLVTHPSRPVDKDSGDREIRLSEYEFLQPGFTETYSPVEIVFFLKGSISRRSRLYLRQIVKAAQNGPVTCLIVLQTLAMHFGDTRAEELEGLLREQLQPVLSGLIIIRTGHVLSPSSATSHWQNRLRRVRRLLLPRMTSTFLDGTRLFRIIDQELENRSESFGEIAFPVRGRKRELTLLGDRRSWSSVLSDSDASGMWSMLMTVLASGLSFLGIPWLMFWSVCLLGRLFPSLRQIHFHTLQPRSVCELICLFNRHNCNDIQIAGCNNGVNHFGWKYPDRTVVLTTSVPGRVRLSHETVLVDAGLTLNHCIRQLNASGREFYVVPNFSYISMGTLFFVPVHGSGSRVSTLSDTIEEALLFDGDTEQFIIARRGDAVFRETIYDRNRHLLLLRLRLRVKPTSVYSVRRSTMEQPSAAQIQALFRDPEASNVEIRKNKATSSSIELRHYFADIAVGGQHSMAIPRDSIGRVWDRLEETPIVSTLFHWYVRTFAFHVELFLKQDEFEIFWNHHQSLPVSKIQLRRILKDGMAHSACENDDCISADLFMTRGKRDVFCQFIAEHLPHVRSNPGKQSL